LPDVFSKEKRSEIMSKIRGKWTKQEIEFYEAHPEAHPHPDFPYHPDFLMDGKVIFLDSSFWHGYVSEEKFGKLNDYWRRKLLKNIIRDFCSDDFYSFLGILERNLYE